MLPKWISATIEARAAARHDAAALLRDHGAGAYQFARDRAREVRLGKVVDADREARHWDRVRAFLARHRGSRIDTASRMVQD